MPTALSNDTLGQIGNTPLVRLNRLAGPDSATVWGKLEGANPGGSVKDRIARAMIEQAEADGAIRPGDTLVEPTSGNTGIGLSLVCTVRGYRLILTMPDTMTLERRRLLGAYGAELVLTPGSLGMRGAIDQAEQLARSQKCFMPQQFRNPANPRVHEQTTGPEILAALGGKVDAFVAGVGTGGTVTGVGQVLKERKPEVQIVAVEPKDSAILNGGAPGPHKIQGLGANFIPDILDTNVYDEVIDATLEDSVRVARDLGIKEGILGGISSGAIVWAALELAKRPENAGKLIVAVVCDFGERYISTVLYDDIRG